MSVSNAVPSVASDPAGVGRRAGQHFERVFRTLATAQGGEGLPEWFRWLTREPHPLGNIVIQSGPAHAALVESSIAPVLRDNLPSAVLFPAGVSAEAKDALLAARFAFAGAMPAMAVDIERLAAPVLPAGCTFERVGPDARGEEWAQALAVGYGLPVGLTRRLSPVEVGGNRADDAPTQFFAVLRDGRIVGTSMLFLADGLAGIYSVATMAEERGKGVGGYLTAEPLRIAHRLGYRVGVLQSSTAGHPVYLGLGFADVGEVPMFIRMPAAPANAA